jgi:hypothetical protein
MKSVWFLGVILALVLCIFLLLGQISKKNIEILELSVYLSQNYKQNKIYKSNIVQQSEDSKMLNKLCGEPNEGNYNSIEVDYQFGAIFFYCDISEDGTIKSSDYAITL